MIRLRASFYGLATVFLLSGCGSSVHAPDAATKNSENLQISKNLIGAPASDKNGVSAVSQAMAVDSAPRGNFAAESPDMKAETEVDEKVLAAWRLACKHDEKGSLAIINELDRKYPKFRTVAAMHAQILDFLGHKKEAIKYYEEASTGNDFDLLHTYKLARAYGTTGDTKKAADCYRKLLKGAPDFDPGKYGLAQALLAEDKDSAEAKTLLAGINPKDKNAFAASDMAEAKKEIHSK